MQQNANPFMMQDIIERWNQGRDRLKRMLLAGNTRRRQGHAGQDDGRRQGRDDVLTARQRLLTLLTTPPRRGSRRRAALLPRQQQQLLHRETAFPFNCRTVYGLEDYYFGLRYAAAMALPSKTQWDGPDLSDGRVQTQSAFYSKLPLEVRNMIYEFVVLEESGSPLPIWCPTHPKGMTHVPRYQLAILRTCKQAYAEVHGVFCSTMAQRYWFTKFPPPKEFNMLYVQRPSMVEYRRQTMQKEWHLETSDECRRYVTRRSRQVEIYAEIPALSRPPSQTNSYDLTCLFAFSDFLREELRPRILKIYLHEGSFSYGWAGQQLGDNLSTDWFRHLVLPRSVKEMIVQMDFVEVISFHNPELYLDLEDDRTRLSKLFAALRIRMEEEDDMRKPDYLTLDHRLMEPLLPECSAVLKRRNLTSLLSFTFTYKRHGRLYMADNDDGDDQ